MNAVRLLRVARSRGTRRRRTRASPAGAGADGRADREERAHAAAEAERQRHQDGLQRLGRMDLARVDRLRRALEAQPGWAAHGVDALSQHIDRADAVRRADEAQRREDERRRQEAEDRAYRGPSR